MPRPKILDPLALTIMLAIAFITLYLVFAMDITAFFPTLFAVTILITGIAGLATLLACSLERIEGVNDPGYISKEVVRKAASTSELEGE